MRISVLGGTLPSGEESLCDSCSFGHKVQGPRPSDRIMECGRINGPKAFIQFPVKECTEYYKRGTPTLRDMEDLAWVLRTGRHGREIGFVKPKDLGLEEKHKLTTEGPW